MNNQVTLTPVPGKNEYRVVKDYYYTSDYGLVVVPRGFLSDGASIPLVFQGLIYTPFHPDVISASVVHDWLFANHQLDFHQANDVFRSILEANGVSPAKVAVMYKAVEGFGDDHWLQTPETLDHLRTLFNSRGSIHPSVYQWPRKVRRAV